jgi:ATP-binding cassette subfamily B protein
MMVMLGCYTYYTKMASRKRQVEIRSRKESDKRQEFYLNESIMNYETIKTFGNEKFEENRYDEILQRKVTNAIKV